MQMRKMGRVRLGRAWVEGVEDAREVVGVLLCEYDTILAHFEWA